MWPRIICLDCRASLRAFAEDPERLRRAATYLEAGLQR
jgi:hypothetical protein